MTYQEVCCGPLSSLPTGPESRCSDLVRSRVIGDWQTRSGRFRIRVNDWNNLQYSENHLYGILRKSGDWLAADVRDGTRNDAVVGQLRLRSEQEGLRLQFKRNSGESWAGVEEVRACTSFSLWRKEADAAAERQSKYMRILLGGA